MLNIWDKAFWKNVMPLALPIALQNLLTSSFTLVDTIMVGQLGDVALSAVGMAGQVSWFLNIVLFGICSGAAMYISQYWGIGDIKNIRKSIGISFLFSMIICTVFVFAGLIFPEEIIRIFNEEKVIIEAGSVYLKLAVWSYPAIVLNLVLSSSLRAVECVRLPLITSLVTTVANAFLDYSLIFGKFGLPAMGVKGAALATVISSWIAPLIILLVSVIEKNILYSHIKEFFTFKLQFVREFAVKTFPVIINETSWGLCIVIFNIIFSNEGYEEYAAMTISRTFENMMFVIFAGLGSACAIMVGKSVGSGNIKRAKEDAMRFTVITPVLGVLLGAVTVIFKNSLVDIFNMGSNISENTYNIATLLLVVFAIQLPLRNMPYLQICGIFRPGGDTTKGMKYDVAATWLISLPATIISCYVLDLPFAVSVAVMYVFDDVPKTILCIKHFLSWKWIKPVTDEGKIAAENIG